MGEDVTYVTIGIRTLRGPCLDQIHDTDKLSCMDAATVGSFLAEQRRDRGLTLDKVSGRMRQPRLSKQALSLIERGRMRVPARRLSQLKVAYGLKRSEQQQLDSLYSFERLVEHTGYDKEFGEAVLSLVDPRKATSIHVIGGKALTLTSPILQARAAEFLQVANNRLVFMEPDFEGLSAGSGSMWSPTSNREMVVIRDTIQSFSRRPIGRQIEFYRVKARASAHDGLLLHALSLCSPYTATTVASSSSDRALAGYVYVEGPKDRWVLLKADHARRILMITNLLLERARDQKGVVRVIL